MAKISTAGSLEIKAGDGLTVTFNLNYLSTTVIKGRQARARMVVKEVKKVEASDINASIHETSEFEVTLKDKITFTLLPEVTSNLSSKVKYYLALQVSIPSENLSAETVYNLVVLDSVVKSLL